MFLYFVKAFTLAASMSTASTLLAKPIELTCDVHFALDKGPNHIFEFYINLD